MGNDLRWFGGWLGMLLSFEGFQLPTIPGPAHDVHDPREIVGEHVQRHLGGHAWQRLGNGPAGYA